MDGKRRLTSTFLVFTLFLAPLTGCSAAQKRWCRDACKTSAEVLLIVAAAGAAGYAAGMQADASEPAYEYAYESPPPFIAENGSYYGEISEHTYRPKTVYVKGYCRTDGTYVRSHYRSLPSP